jgi:DNA primase small subunit
MNDYDDVRTCCEGKKTCQKCWKFMLVARDVISRTLQEDFGFTKLMYVFSGGRGMHIWVCDEEARKMPDSLRKAIVDYLEVVTGNDKAASLLAENTVPNQMPVFTSKNTNRTKEVIKAEMLAGLHPHINRSIAILKKWFFEVINEQNPFTHAKCSQVIFKVLEARSTKLKNRVIERWSNCQQTMEKMWAELLNEVDIYEMTTTDEDYPFLPHEIYSRRVQRITFIEEEIILSFLYPRMDYNVSTMQNHLLKLPFSIHPSTGKVSVPMFTNEVDNFDPSSCVNLEGLMKELNSLDREGALSATQDTVENAHKSSLA